MPDFFFCCLLAVLLAQPPKYKFWLFLSLFLGCMGILVGLVCLGPSIVSLSFFESLSAINQTVEGTVFAAVVGLIVVIWEIIKLRKEKRKLELKIFIELIGRGAIAAITAWFAVFLFFAFYKVPQEITNASGKASMPVLTRPAPAPLVKRSLVKQSPLVKRSYLVSDGGLRFGRRVGSNGYPRADQNFQVGDLMWFDFYFKNLGPNPVDITKIFSRLYFEPNTEPETEEAVIADFKKATKRIPFMEARTIAPFVPSDTGRPFSSAMTADNRVATQDDLDALRDGTEVAYVLAEITYKDNGKTHHLRRCEWLHRPPVVEVARWESCRWFTKPD